MLEADDAFLNRRAYMHGADDAHWIAHMQKGDDTVLRRQAYMQGADDTRFDHACTHAGSI
jgi:hypothetical protein